MEMNLWKKTLRGTEVNSHHRVIFNPVYGYKLWVVSQRRSKLYANVNLGWEWVLCFVPLKLQSSEPICDALKELHWNACAESFSSFDLIQLSKYIPFFFFLMISGWVLVGFCEEVFFSWPDSTNQDVGLTAHYLHLIPSICFFRNYVYNIYERISNSL